MHTLRARHALKGGRDLRDSRFQNKFYENNSEVTKSTPILLVESMVPVGGRKKRER